MLSLFPAAWILFHDLTHAPIDLLHTIAVSAAPGGAGIIFAGVYRIVRKRRWVIDKERLVLIFFDKAQYQTGVQVLITKEEDPQGRQ